MLPMEPSMATPEKPSAGRSSQATPRGLGQGLQQLKLRHEQQQVCPQPETEVQVVLDHVLELVRTGAAGKLVPDGVPLMSTSPLPGPQDLRRSVSSKSEGPVEVTKLDYPRFEQTFRRIRLLGRGAFGEVWRCEHLESGQDYAVKVVRYRAGGFAGHVVEDHISREAQTLAMMSHANVVRFYDAWIEKNDGTNSGGDSNSSGSASSLSQTPFAPPPSPAFKPTGRGVEPPPFSLDEGEELDGFSYDAGSCGSGVDIVFEWNEEELSPAQENEAASKVTAKARPSMLLDDDSRSLEPPGQPERAPAAPPSPSRAELRASRTSATLQEDTDHYSPEYTATFYVQVELCRESTLQGWIANRNALCKDSILGASQPWVQKALGFFLQCVRALLHLHSRSCVHRDVKPANILFARKDGSIRLGDFGLAKVLTDNSETAYPGPDGPSPQLPLRTPASPQGGRGSRCTVGTPSYASPEQLAGRPVGAGTDVYALGLVLAELICPVQTQMERAAVFEGLRERREMPPAVVSAFQPLADLAIRMTDPEPSQRPSAFLILQKARQIYRELKRQSSRMLTGGTFAASAGASLSPVAKVTAFLQRDGRRKSPKFFVGGGHWRRRNSGKRLMLQAAASPAAHPQKPRRASRGHPEKRSGTMRVCSSCVSLACSACAR